jgi:hypothetical protein
MSGCADRAQLRVSPTQQNCDRLSGDTSRFLQGTRLPSHIPQDVPVCPFVRVDGSLMLVVYGDVTVTDLNTNKPWILIILSRSDRSNADLEPPAVGTLIDNTTVAVGTFEDENGQRGLTAKWARDGISYELMYVWAVLDKRDLGVKESDGLAIVASILQ